MIKSEIHDHTLVKQSVYISGRSGNLSNDRIHVFYPLIALIRRKLIKFKPNEY